MRGMLWKRVVTGVDGVGVKVVHRALVGKSAEVVVGGGCISQGR